MQAVAQPGFRFQVTEISATNAMIAPLVVALLWFAGGAATGGAVAWLVYR